MQKVETYHADESFTPVEASEQLAAPACMTRNKSCQDTIDEKSTRLSNENEHLLPSTRLIRKSDSRKTAVFAVKVAALSLYIGLLLSYFAITTPNFLEINTAENNNGFPQGHYSIGFFSYHDNAQHKTFKYGDYEDAEKPQHFLQFDAFLNAARIFGVLVIFLGGIVTLIVLFFVFFFSRPFSTMLGTFSIVWIIYNTVHELLGIPKLGAIIIVAGIACTCVVTSFVCKSWFRISSCLSSYAVVTSVTCIFQMLTYLAFNSDICKENNKYKPFSTGFILSLVATNCWLVGSMLLFILSQLRDLVLDNPLKEDDDYEELQQANYKTAIDSYFGGVNSVPSAGMDETCETTIATYFSTESLQIGFEDEQEEEIIEAEV